MNGRAPISDSDLHAFIDGALDRARQAEIETAINADPALAARAEGFAADRAMLKRIYAPLADKPVPKAWIALVGSDAIAQQPAKPWRQIAAIAAVVVLGVIGAVGYWRSEPARPGEIVEAALQARTQPVRGERIVAVAAGADIRRYDAALKRAVDMNVKVPDLDKMGYRLAGLHLYARGGHAAELLYRDHQGRLFTLYVRHSDGAARFDQFERKGLRVCVWQDEELGTVMAGNVSTAAMQRLASLAYTGLTL